MTNSYDVDHGLSQCHPGPLEPVEISDCAAPGVSTVEEDGTTPGATWREKGEADPHGTRYNCERAALTLGTLTDDELANGAFLAYDRQPSVDELLSGKGFTPIVWMTAVKDRIRWLSRKLAEAEVRPAPAAGDALDAARWRAYAAQFPEISAAFLAMHGADPLPTIKGASITGGYVVVTPAGWDADKATKLRDAILRLFPVNPAHTPRPSDELAAQRKGDA
jgi:hypothetical protein